MTEVWIIEEFFNEYDQHGGYLVNIYVNEPTENDIKNLGYTEFGFPKNNRYVASWVTKSKVSVIAN